MADQQIPPELMAALAQGQNGGSPQPEPPMLTQDPAEVADALLRACKVAAENAATAQDTREISEAGKAALAFAQAVVILDPNLTQSGEPIDHALEMESLRGQNAVALENARGANAVEAEHTRGLHALEVAKHNAAAPTPSRRISVKRDGTGRATSYETES